MNKENCALKLVDEIILYYDAGRKNIKISQTLRDAAPIRFVPLGFAKPVFLCILFKDSNITVGGCRLRSRGDLSSGES